MEISTLKVEVVEHRDLHIFEKGNGGSVSAKKKKKKKKNWHL